MADANPNFKGNPILNEEDKIKGLDEEKIGEEILTKEQNKNPKKNVKGKKEEEKKNENKNDEKPKSNNNKEVANTRTNNNKDNDKKAEKNNIENLGANATIDDFLKNVDEELPEQFNEKNALEKLSKALHSSEKDPAKGAVLSWVGKNVNKLEKFSDTARRLVYNSFDEHGLIQHDKGDTSFPSLPSEQSAEEQSLNCIHAFATKYLLSDKAVEDGDILSIANAEAKIEKEKKIAKEAKGKEEGGNVQLTQGEDFNIKNIRNEKSI